MKYLFILTACFFLTASIADAQVSKNNLVGTWQLVSQKGVYKGTPVSSDSSKKYQVKVITANKFMFTVYDKDADTLSMSAQGSVYVNGNTYKETITHATSKDMIGRSFTYSSSVAGNKWRIKGGAKDLELEETWIKIK